MEAPLKKPATGLECEAAASFSSSSSSSPITNLPTSILMEILCRLPIKALVACKSVCKSLLHLTKDPDFTELHQSRAPIEVCSHSSSDNTATKLYLISSNFPINSHLPAMQMDALFQIPKFSVRTTNALNFNMASSIKFVDSCNGLLCFHGLVNNFAMIWNPITSEVVTFPAPKPQYRSCWISCMYGLGFSRKANRYKLLCLGSQRAMERYEPVVVASICTIVKIYSWKKLSPTPYDNDRFRLKANREYSFLSRAVYLHGALHWVVEGENYDSDVAMFSFDFEDDRFGGVALPPRLESRQRLQLGVLAGCMSMTDTTKDGLKWNIWLMKEYGVQDSWTKLCSVDFTEFERFRFRGCVPCCVPLTYLDNGEILMTTSMGDVFSYSPILKSIKILAYRQGIVIAYRPTLVLLKDSVMGYEVHADIWSRYSEHKETSRSPSCCRSMMQQTEQLKQQNQQLERRLETEQTNVEQLKQLIQQSEQLRRQDKQLMMQTMDEMRAQLKEQIQQGERLQQQNQMMLQMFDGVREHLRGSL